MEKETQSEIYKYVRDFIVAHDNSDFDECAEILLKLNQYDALEVKRVLFKLDAIKSPLGKKYSRTYYDNLKKIISKFLVKSKEAGIIPVDMFMALLELLNYSELFYNNNKNLQNKLKACGFLKLSLAEQLSMIGIYIQDQSRMMKLQMNKQIINNKVITGFEGDTTFINDRYVPSSKSSISDSFEMNIENFNILIRYLFYLKKEELLLEESKIINYYPYDNKEFEEILLASHYSNMYGKLEKKIRYQNWKIEKTDNTYVIQCADKEKEFIRQVAIERRKIEDFYNLFHYTDIPSVRKYYTKMIDFAKSIYNIELKELDLSEELFAQFQKAVENQLSFIKNNCKHFYVNKQYGDISYQNYLSGYEFLLILSIIFEEASLCAFNANDKTTYNKLIEILDIDFLVNNFSRIYFLPTKEANTIMKSFIFDNTTDSSFDLFTNPLIKVNKKQIIFCPALITQMNMERNIEKLVKNKLKKYAQVGFDFEKDIIQRLINNPYFHVNTNKLEFCAYDGNVEFDCLATIDEYLILIEQKSLMIPYDEYELHKCEKTIIDAANQLKRREKIVQKDWDKIRNLVNIELPEEPISKEKIIKIVCIDIYDFTSLSIGDVIITDSSTLLKYITNPYVLKCLKGKNGITIEELKFLWKNDEPNAIEFINHLKNPHTIIPYRAKVQEKNRPLLRLNENDYGIIYKAFYLTEEPIKYEQRPVKKHERIYPNDKCPCGSGKKYKKCCGK